MDSDFLGDIADNELVQRVQNNDMHAFTQLFHRYNADICRHIMHIVKDSEDAKDLTQRTFENAYKGLSRLNNGASFRSWIYQIADNVTKDHLRAKNRRPLPSEKDFDADQEDFDAAFENQVIQAILFEQAWGLTKKLLTPTQASCFVLHCKGTKLIEIGRLLGLSEGTVRTYISKVYSMLLKTYRGLQDCHEDA